MYLPMPGGTGFYEQKSYRNEFKQETDHLIETGQKTYIYPHYPKANGNTTRPARIFGKPWQPVRAIRGRTDS
jgi:hypothetical protein